MCNAPSFIVRFAFILFSAVMLLGCNGRSDGGGSSAGSGGSGSDAGATGSGNPDADKALMAKIEQHWTKAREGWTTQLTEQLPLNPPIRVLKQYRELKYTLAPETLSEADKLNGIEWKAWADFAPTSMRYWRYEYPKGWSQWREDSPWYRPAVYKRNGQWIVEEPTMGNMFEGTKPTDVPST